MKHVRKSPEPPELAQYRERFKTQFKRWSDLKSNRKTYNAIRTTLAADQKGICAYCEMSLHSQDRAVEHFIPCNQSTREQNLDLDWHNMLATCQGGLQNVKVPGEDDSIRNSRPPNNFPCCGAKKSQEYDKASCGNLLNPLELPSISIFSFSSLDGSIKPNAVACEQANITVQQAQFTIDTLNLNVQRLKRQRLAVIVAARSMRDQLDDGVADFKGIEAKLAAKYFVDGSGNWQPFFSALRFALGEGAELYLSQFS